MNSDAKLLAIANFMLQEGIRVEDEYKLTLSRRTVQWRDCDQLDMLELIRLQDRVEYFNEVCTIIENIVYGRHRARERPSALDRHK